MAVTDEQVATLKALFAGDVEEHKRLLAGLDPRSASIGYSALITAGFFEAVDRRFAATGTVADVIQFVADVRARADEIAQDLDPTLAERIIRHALGDGSIDDLDDRAVFSAQMVLLGALIGDEQLDEEGLDAFLAEVRAVADEWTA